MDALAARQTPIPITTIATHSAGSGISPRTGIARIEATAGRSAMIAVAAEGPSNATAPDSGAARSPTSLKTSHVN